MYIMADTVTSTDWLGAWLSCMVSREEGTVARSDPVKPLLRVKNPQHEVVIVLKSFLYGTDPDP